MGVRAGGQTSEEGGRVEGPEIIIAIFVKTYNNIVQYAAWRARINRHRVIVLCVCSCQGVRSAYAMRDRGHGGLEFVCNVCEYPPTVFRFLNDLNWFRFRTYRHMINQPTRGQQQQRVRYTIT